MAGRSRSFWAIGLGMIAWSLLLFSPLAFVGQARADDVENWGTVIGIVSDLSIYSLPILSLASSYSYLSVGNVGQLLTPIVSLCFRIWERHTLVSV